MVQRHRIGPAHQRMAAQGAVKAGQATHFENLPDAIPLFSDQPTASVEKLDFTAGVRAVTQFIFQPLQMYAVTLTVRQQARNKKAGEPRRRLRQYQMSIALRHGEKPFMSNQMIKAFGGLLRTGRVAQDIRSPLLFSHPHADKQPAFLISRYQMRIVAIA